jgi:phospholipid/cholesterol/gamma-HCH transport system substrate-binding protein
MTLARGLAVGALGAVVVIAAVLLLRGTPSHEYTLLFQTAGQLVTDNDVQVGGRRVGRVAEIKLTDDNLAEVRIQVEEPYAPLHRGTTAQIRSGSLSGQANHYVQLSPGPETAPELEPGSTLGLDSTVTEVSLDQLFDTFDERTRNALRNIIRGSSTQFGDDGEKAGEALKYLNPALSTSARIVDELTRDQKAFEQFIVATARASTALAERRDDLADAIANTNEASKAIADEAASLDQALAELPDALRQANTTFVNLRNALDDLDKLVDASEPVAPELAPFFRELRPLVEAARPTIADLRRMITSPGAANDLTDLLRGQPRLTEIAEPALRHAGEAFRESGPVLQFARPYAPDLISWFRDFGQSTANYDANGHFARVSPVVDAFSFTLDSPTSGTLTAKPGAERKTGLQRDKAKRCPGAAATPAPDGSNPYTPAGSDCDRSAVLPGP